MNVIWEFALKMLIVQTRWVATPASVSLASVEMAKHALVSESSAWSCHIWTLHTAQISMNAWMEVTVVMTMQCVPILMAASLARAYLDTREMERCASVQ